MRYLGLALLAEGPTDHRFLALVLGRLVEHLCNQHARTLVEFGTVYELQAPAGHRRADRPTQILEAARAAEGMYDVLFIHSDGAGDPEAAYATQVEPGVRRLVADLGRADERVVAVIPVREMEAWTMADGDALRSAFGTTLDNNALGVPGRARDVEALPDPKASLEQAYVAVVGRQRKRRASAFLDAIGERVRLDVLRQVPAFGRLEEDLRVALTELGYFR